MIKKVLITLIFVSFFCASGLSFAKEMKLAFVDLQKAMRGVDQGKEASQRLISMKDVKQKELERDESKLKKEGEALKKQQNVLSEEAFGKKYRDFTKRQLEFQKKVEKYEMELMKSQNEFAQDILEDMETIIVGIGKKEDYDFIFERGSSKLLYAQKGHDLTQEVIDLYNKRFGKKLSKSKK